jgi:hypothetical protein
MARANLAFCASIFPRNRVAAGDFRHEAVLHEAMARMAAFGALQPMAAGFAAGSDLAGTSRAGIARSCPKRFSSAVEKMTAAMGKRVFQLASTGRVFDDQSFSGSS